MKMDGAVCAGALALNVLATSIFLNLPIPEDSGWALLRPFALIVTFSAVVHVPKQCKQAASPEKDGGGAAPVRYVVLGGILLSALLIIVWISTRLYRDAHQLAKEENTKVVVHPQHAQMIAVLVLELVLIGAIFVMFRQVESG